jgi:adenylate cyclase
MAQLIREDGSMARSPFLAAFTELLFGMPAPETLPARVARQIEQQQQQSEVLIGWAQAAIVVFFGSFYLIAPKTFPPDVWIKPVPWALGFYALFTALRLWLAYRRALRPWLIGLSVVIDIAVLLVTIWSFHLQYAEPAAFYLKAPTLLYIFIFIALRTLRYEPGYVILAGLSAAGGWLLLLVYALSKNGMSMITRDYVHYMTSPSVLIGAEVDKIVSILLVTAVLGVSIVRARRLLARSAAEHIAAADLSRFFAPDVVQTILRSDEALKPGDGVLREAAALFIDLRGFTKLSSELDPKALVELLGEYQRLVLATIRKHNGSLTTFLGDGAMVTFGATRPSDTYAADALRAVEELLDELGAWAQVRGAAGKPAPGIGIGATVGTVVCGAIGDETRLEYAILGDPVNRAAKLQNQTKVEGVRALTTPLMLERAAGQGYACTRARRFDAPHQVQGIAEPVALIALA